MNKKFSIIAFGLLVSFIFMTSCKSKQTTETSTTTSQKVEKKRDATSTSTDSRPDRRNGGDRPNHEDMFVKMDTNNDGKLSKSEAQGPFKNDFSKIDTNGDGYLTKEELKNAPRPERGSGGRPPRK